MFISPSYYLYITVYITFHVTLLSPFQMHVFFFIVVTTILIYQCSHKDIQFSKSAQCCSCVYDFSARHLKLYNQMKDSFLRKQTSISSSYLVAYNALSWDRSKTVLFYIHMCIGVLVQLQVGEPNCEGIMGEIPLSFLGGMRSQPSSDTMIVLGYS